MSDATSAQSSLAERVRPLHADAPVVAVHFLGEIAAFVLGEEAVLLAGAGEPQRVPLHSGAILTSACNGARLVTGGDDGKVMALAADGEPRLVASDEARHWIDRVAVGPDGAVAWSAGKTAFVKTGKGETRSRDVVSTVGGLAFAPKGLRLAIAHYNGATLWFPNVQTAPETLEWKGSHLGVTFSPNGRYLVTAMQEPTLHGWRLADRQPMRMSGYSARVRSLDWTTGGRFLATGGADRLILWPFHGKDGPMGKQPEMLAPHDAAVVAVACHPAQEAVAAGYADGLVLLVRMSDGAEIPVKPAGASPVSALAWDGGGRTLAFACENGEAGILRI